MGSSIKRFFTAIIILILIPIAIYLLIQLYLWVHFVIGNDILIKLSSDKSNINISHGQNETVTFNINVLANPFCSVKCTSIFEDLSSGRIIETNNFTITTTSSIDKEYIITANKLGSGQQMFRFKVECTGIKTSLCDTKEVPTDRKILLIVNYGLNDRETEIKISSEKLAQNIILQLESIDSSIASLNAKISEINNSALSNISISVKNAERTTSEKTEQLDEIRNLWDIQDYEQLEFKISSLNESIFRLSKDINEIDKTIENESKKEMLEYVQNLSFNYNKLCILTGICGNPFSQLNLSENNITSKDSCNYTNQLMNLYETINNTNESEFFKNNYNLTCNLYFTRLKERSPAENKTISITFEQQPNICCFKDICNDCCINETCRNNVSNYPIIFIHGHDFSKDVPSDYSVDRFKDVESKLEDKGYLAAGIVSVSTPKEDFGSWGMAGIPIVIRGNYYFDVYKSSSTNEIVQAKSESIDNYAIRLRDIVDIVKYKTGSPKVIIIAHSMGGLVARRYVQIFGNESVDKLILVTVPNHGIEGSISTYCPVFGSKIECSEMNKDSLFINKLNNNPAQTVKTYNIIGSGCITDDQPSDGIVLEKNAFLETADNYQLNGTCYGITANYHSVILNIWQYPETYTLLKKLIDK